MISGSTTQGQTLTEAHGSWTNSPMSYAYQWEDCDASGNSCTAISGATGQTYVLTAGDVGHTIRVQERATNEGGTGEPASSAATAVVKELEGGGGETATASAGHVAVSGTTASAPLECAGSSGASCTITLTMSVTEKLMGGKILAISSAERKAKTTRRTVIVGKKTISIGVGQRETVNVNLNAAGMHLLATHHKLSVRLKATQATSGGTALLTSQKITFKAKPKKGHRKRWG
jgi:hypothetical protein